MSAKSKKSAQESSKGIKSGGEEVRPFKEGNLIWLAIAIIAVFAAFVLVVNRYGPKDEETPDELLVRKVVRDQFEAIFEKDFNKFINCFSWDFSNGDDDYNDKVEIAKQVMEVDFEIIDDTFDIRFIESGPNEVAVHFDHDRGFASTFTYTYWKQRSGDKITRMPMLKLGAFLLRKEGNEWRIISDKSIALQKEEDAPSLINSAQFRPFTDPTTIVWPPPAAAPVEEKKVPEAQPEPEGDNATGGNIEEIEVP